MSYSPLVSIIRVHNTNKKGTANANRNNLTYIATREGVALDGIKDINDFLNKIDGMMERDLDENLIHKEADDKEYMEYMARRPRSQGLFGNIDTDNLEEIAQKVYTLSKEGRNIYRGIISLSQADGEALGFKTTDAWYNYMKKVMPDIAKELGISITDHTWVAAFHAEEKHPHVHYELWDNKDKVKSPFIHTSVQKRCREIFSAEMFDNEYENMIKEMHEIELNELKEVRNTERTKILDLSKDVFDNIGYVPGAKSEKLPDKIKNEDSRKIVEETNKLIPLLPEKGRLNYNFLPAEAKEQINKISELVLQRLDIKQELDLYLNAVQKMHEIYGETKSEVNRAVSDARYDITKRVNNRILKEVKSSILGLGNAELMDSIMDEGNNVSSKSVNGTITDSKNMDNTIEHSSYYIEWNNDYKKAMELIYDEDSDLKRALHILDKEAMSGNVIAISEVAKFIEKDLYEGVDKKEADIYYKESSEAYKAVNEKSENKYLRKYAAYRLGKLYEFGKIADIGVDYQQAKNWYEKAGDNKYALFSLGKLYLNNKIFVSEDCSLKLNQEEAFKNLKKSFGFGNPFAAYELGKMYSKGIGVELNKELANSYYRFYERENPQF